MEWELDNVPARVGWQRVIMLLPPGEDVDEKRPLAWYERWTWLRKTHEFLPPVSADSVAILYDASGHPSIVACTESSVPKRLAAVKAAWLPGLQWACSLRQRIAQARHVFQPQADNS